MLKIVLYNPLIPPNTGNIIRLCANTGADLHLIEPLGFKLDDKKMRRAGLDYHEFADVKVHANWQAYLNTIGDSSRVFLCETGSTRYYNEVEYQANDTLVFGAETYGIPADILSTLPANQHISIPMQVNNRSINLSNCAAIVLFEAWRQLGFSSD